MVCTGQIDQQFLVKLKFCMKKYYGFDQKKKKKTKKNKRPPPFICFISISLGVS